MFKITEYMYYIDLRGKKIILIPGGVSVIQAIHAWHTNTHLWISRLIIATTKEKKNNKIILWD